jgi:hypothetical protein
LTAPHAPVSFSHFEGWLRVSPSRDRQPAPAKNLQIRSSYKERDREREEREERELKEGKEAIAREIAERIGVPGGRTDGACRTLL